MSPTHHFSSIQFVFRFSTSLTLTYFMFGFLISWFPNKSLISQIHFFVVISRKKVRWSNLLIMSNKGNLMRSASYRRLCMGLNILLGVGVLFGKIGSKNIVLT